MDAEQLAAGLAERMREVVPPGIRIQEVGDTIWFADDSPSARSGGAGTYACQVLHKDGDPEHRLVEACWRALDDLQDFIDESTTEPWPGTRNVPRPGAYIDGDEVLLWYGDIRHPALRLRPIPLER